MRRCIALFAIAGCGCAADLARASSGAIGCSHREIEVSSISLGWSTTTWRAECRGVVFHCAGEDAPSCASELSAVVPVDGDR
jgi:hypothetical protein